MTEHAIYYALVGAWLLGFWYLYVLIMGLYRAYLSDKLRGIPMVLAIPALVLGYVVDLLTNWTIAWAIFREPPRTPLELVTDRLSRYMKGPEGWQRRWATGICNGLLDAFDPSGTHCK